MTPAKLLSIIKALPAHTHIADNFCDKPGMYETHQAHWIGWLSEYDGPGYYNRSGKERDARFVWNHLQNVGMLIYLAEAVGVQRDVVWLANQKAGILQVKSKARACKVVRSHLPWSPVILGRL